MFITASYSSLCCVSGLAFGQLAVTERRLRRRRIILSEKRCHQQEQCICGISCICKLRWHAVRLWLTSAHKLTVCHRPCCVEMKIYEELKTTRTSCVACNAAATICSPRSLQMVTWTATQSGLVTLTFDLLTLELVLNVSRGRTTTFLPILVFSASASATLFRRVMSKHASNWRRVVMTLTFDLSGHRACRRCGSSYSIYAPMLIS